MPIWNRLFNFIIKDVQEIRRLDMAISRNYYWQKLSPAQKIETMAEEKFISSDISEVVEKTNSLEGLYKLRQLFTQLSEEHGQMMVDETLWKKVFKKIVDLEDKQLLRKILKQAREESTSFIEDVVNFLC